MDRRNSVTRKSFQYNFNKKRSTTVEFDVVEQAGKKVPINITLLSNWRSHYPTNPQISFMKGEYGFSGNGIVVTNGDIQQMIKRIFQIVEETKD